MGRARSPDAGRDADAGREPYYVPRTRYFEGRPGRAGGDLMVGTMASLGRSSDLGLSG